MNLLAKIVEIIKPVGQIIDQVHTSEEERAKLKNELFVLQAQLQVEVLEYEKNLLNKQSQIITAEAQGNSWLQRSWRPITMLTFLVLVCLDAFGWLAFRLSDQAWVLLQIGLGGYVIGRSGEKIAQPVIKAMKDHG
jgi:hypothetical protein|tara:strand:- start:4790 stop:5197 length:408 start_codon:yes stop_codon:yes gene_type:complete